MSGQIGWIKLHRKVRQSACFNDPNPAVFKVWMYCLMEANHSESNFLRNGKQVRLCAGQFPYSRTAWAKHLGLRASTLRNLIEKLRNWDMIQDISQDSQRVTIFQINNWDKYQVEDTCEDTNLDMSRTRTGHEQDTLKNDKNKENEKKPSASLLLMNNSSKKGKTPYATSESLTATELQRIADLKGVSLADVRYVLDKVMGWPKAHTVKDWNLTVQSWLVTEIREGKVRARGTSEKDFGLRNALYIEPEKVSSGFDTNQIRRNLTSKLGT